MAGSDILPNVIAEKQKKTRRRGLVFVGSYDSHLRSNSITRTCKKTMEMFKMKGAILQENIVSQRGLMVLPHCLLYFKNGGNYRK